MSQAASAPLRVANAELANQLRAAAIDGDDARMAHLIAELLRCKGLRAVSALPCSNEHCSISCSRYDPPRSTTSSPVSTIAAALFRLVRGYLILRLATSARCTWCTSVSRIWSESARRMAEMPGRFSSKTAATSFGICFPITAYTKYWAEWLMMSSRRSRCARNSARATASSLGSGAR